jgi:hypothetical protein
MMDDTQKILEQIDDIQKIIEQVLEESNKYSLLRLVESDIKNAIYFEEEYKDIKNQYLNASTDEELKRVKEKHSEITKKEMLFYYECMRSIERLTKKA